jgi:cell division protein FtsI/penicillin-binding protein 2
MLAATIANGGLWHAPILFDSEPVPPADRVLPEAHARELADMMEETVTEGTARRIFRERGFHVKGAVGKTGSLSDRRPFRDYSWFVGYAPKDKPAVAVGAVVVNSPFWRIKGAWLGREAMRLAIDQAAKNATAAAAP